MKRFYITCWLTALLLSPAAFAGESNNGNTWSYIQDTLSQTWNAEDYELFIPVNVWHNRSYYSSEKIDSYNENPWGLGLGKYRFDNE